MLISLVKKAIMLILLVIGVLGIVGLYKTLTDENIKLKREQREAGCEIPQVVAEVEGVKLYKARLKGCSDHVENVIYFSKSGTQGGWKECSGGKTSHCRTVIRRVPNQN